MENLSPHISYKEATRSHTATKKGIKNIPNELQLANMKELAVNVFEPLRVWAAVPIFIASFFRSILLNTVIGGAIKSQHCAFMGAAIDIDADNYGRITNKELFEYIRDNLEFDQLIWEFGNDDHPEWIHISFNKGKNRNRVLRAFSTKSGTKYIVL